MKETTVRRGHSANSYLYRRERAGQGDEKRKMDSKRTKANVEGENLQG